MRAFVHKFNVCPESPDMASNYGICSGCINGVWTISANTYVDTVLTIYHLKYSTFHTRFLFINLIPNVIEFQTTTHCKHSYKLHNNTTRKCHKKHPVKGMCWCSGFVSSFGCACGQPFSSHHTLFETVELFVSVWSSAMSTNDTERGTANSGKTGG